MAVNEDDINDALNTPTDQLGEDDYEDDQQDDGQGDGEDDQRDDGQDDGTDDQQDDTTGEDLVDVLLGKQKDKPEGRVQRLANERRDAEVRATRAEEESRQLRERLQIQEDDRVARARAERQRELDEMDPAERRLLVQEEETRRMRMEIADTRDREQFRSFLDQNPQLRTLQDDVEKELDRARRTGQFVTREAVATFIMGQRAMKALKEGPKAKAAGKKRIEHARGKPVGASSDGRGEQRSSSSTSDFEKKFGNMKL